LRTPRPPARRSGGRRRWWSWRRSPAFPVLLGRHASRHRSCRSCPSWTRATGC